MSYFFLERRNNKSGPLAFIIFNANDDVVLPATKFRHVEALIERKAPVTYLLNPRGGYALENSDCLQYENQIIKELTEWLNNMKGINH